MASRARLDRLLVDKGLVESREKAARLILAGEVMVDGQRVDKAGALVAARRRHRAARPLALREPRRREARPRARRTSTVDVTGRVCIDVGASTGGFTDCLLQQGAAQRLRGGRGHGPARREAAQGPARRRDGADQRARRSTRASSPSRRSLAIVDVSFISLEKVLPAVFGVLAPRGEVDRAREAAVRGRHASRWARAGVVRDPRAAPRGGRSALARYAVLRGWHVLGVTASPLRGPKGNREFFLHLLERTAAPLAESGVPDRPRRRGGACVKRVGSSPRPTPREARTVVPAAPRLAARRAGSPPVLEKETAALVPRPRCRRRAKPELPGQVDLLSSSAATAPCSRWPAPWATSACRSSASTWAASASSPRPRSTSCCPALEALPARASWSSRSG